jgi:hypothetical protein
MHSLKRKEVYFLITILFTFTLYDEILFPDYSCLKEFFNYSLSV